MSHKLLIRKIILRILKVTSCRPSWNINSSRFLRVAYWSILSSKELSWNLLWEWFLTYEWGGILCYHFLVLLVVSGRWGTSSYLGFYSKYLTFLYGHIGFISIDITISLFGFVKLLIVREILSKRSHILECFVNKWVFVDVSWCSSIAISRSSLLHYIST